jgi:uncharacterized membrane protein
MTIEDGHPARRQLPKAPVVRRIGIADIAAAFAEGWNDFRRAPLFGLFFGAFYAAGGLLIFWLLFRLDMIYMAIPLVIGFMLLGPFVAVGLYEVSRRLESGTPLTWGGVLGVMLRQREREFVWMSFVTLFVFWIWIYQVRLLLALFFGMKTFSTFAAFLTLLFTTANGLTFLAVGHIVGAFLSLVLFSITVVSFPLLLDRDVDFITAMITSVKAVFTSPLPMLGWGIAIVALTFLAVAPAFLGLLVVLPVLGHTTWHLYRRLVAPP